MLCSRSGTHLKHDVLQTRRLSSRPVNAGSRVPGWNIRRIDDKVAYLSVEDVGRTPIEVCPIIFVSVNKAESGEPRGGLDGWNISWVADQVGVVLINDRGRD
jgi:hypothetical protein